MDTSSYLFINHKCCCEALTSMHFSVLEEKIDVNFQDEYDPSYWVRSRYMLMW